MTSLHLLVIPLITLKNVGKNLYTYSVVIAYNTYCMFTGVVKGVGRAHPGGGNG